MLKYTDKELFQIGQNVASGWGACCESFTVNNYEQKITFHCNEFGEKFNTTLIFEELDEYYY